MTAITMIPKPSQVGREVQRIDTMSTVTTIRHEEDIDTAGLQVPPRD